MYILPAMFTCHLKRTTWTSMPKFWFTKDWIEEKFHHPHNRATKISWEAYHIQLNCHTEMKSIIQIYKINITVSYLKFVRCAFHTIKLTCSSIFSQPIRSFFRQLNPCGSEAEYFWFCLLLNFYATFNLLVPQKFILTFPADRAGLVIFQSPNN